VQAEHELVKLEPPLSRAFELETLGDNFATVVDALRLGLVNQPGCGLSLDQWATWKDAAIATLGPGLKISEANMIETIERLEAARWTLDPPNFAILSDFPVGAGGAE
jgi:hypothetical protein